MTTTLKEALAQRGMTVARLSEVSGVSKRTLDAYMTGYRKVTRSPAHIMLAIADALDIDPRALTDPPGRQR